MMDAKTATTDVSDAMWEEIADAQAEWIRQRVLRRIDDHSVADDITQEVLLAAFEKRGECRCAGDLRPWLYRVLVNRVADHYRRKYANERRQQGYADIQVDEQDATPVDCGLIEAENRERLEEAIKQLVPEDRELMEMKFRDDKTYQEIAQHFKTTERTIEYRLVRVKQQLRDQMLNHE